VATVTNLIISKTGKIGVRIRTGS